MIFKYFFHLADMFLAWYLYVSPIVQLRILPLSSLQGGLSQFYSSGILEKTLLV